MRRGPERAWAWFAALGVACTFAAGGVAAEERKGFYLSSGMGIHAAPGVFLVGHSDDRASRCDEFINPRYAEVEGCTTPDRGSGAGWRTSFDSARGLFAGAALGYDFGGRLRLEAEYFHRDSKYDQSAPVASATGATFAKLGGEIQVAEERINSVTSDSVFANLYVDFGGDGRWNPYVGVGVGLGATEIDYGTLWARNTDPDSITTAAGLPNEEEVRRNLAGTVTSETTTLDDELTGYQVIAGLNYALGDHVSLDFEARWTDFDGFYSLDGDGWRRLRSHPSQLRLDGSEPVSYWMETDDTDIRVVSVSLRYDF
ncbi:MAG: outer membrane beta-barrel protein [Acidobacteria bacterium]|nr:outer membrane beta-barrel protein [Acidobacteriota bacterium]